jgi:hypothetical protein
MLIIQGGFTWYFTYMYHCLIRLTPSITCFFTIILLSYYSTAFTAFLIHYCSIYLSHLLIVPSDRPSYNYSKMGKAVADKNLGFG